jgi:hypothetical protein
MLLALLSYTSRTASFEAKCRECARLADVWSGDTTGADEAGSYSRWPFEQ